MKSRVLKFSSEWILCNRKLFDKMDHELQNYQTQIETQFSKLAMHFLQIYVYMSLNQIVPELPETSGITCHTASYLQSFWNRCTNKQHTDWQASSTAVFDGSSGCNSSSPSWSDSKELGATEASWNPMFLREKEALICTIHVSILRSPQISCTLKIGWIPRFVFKICDGFVLPNKARIVLLQKNKVRGCQLKILQWPPSANRFWIISSILVPISESGITFYSPVAVLFFAARQAREQDRAKPHGGKPIESNPSWFGYPKKKKSDRSNEDFATNLTTWAPNKKLRINIEESIMLTYNPKHKEKSFHKSKRWDDDEEEEEEEEQQQQQQEQLQERGCLLHACDHFAVKFKRTEKCW